MGAPLLADHFINEALAVTMWLFHLTMVVFQELEHWPNS